MVASRPDVRGSGNARLVVRGLAQCVGSSDARQISRYENGRITLSLDATIRIAEVQDAGQ